jgi:hypothetical protein
MTNIPTEITTVIFSFVFGTVINMSFFNTWIFTLLVFTAITICLYLPEYLEISPDGIYGLPSGLMIKIGKFPSRAGGGSGHFYKWEEMYHVKRGLFLLSGIIFVHCKFKRVMMIPLYLKENQGFLDIINRAAPDGNPVKNYFVSSRSAWSPNDK